LKVTGAKGREKNAAAGRLRSGGESAAADLGWPFINLLNGNQRNDRGSRGLRVACRWQEVFQD